MKPWIAGILIWFSLGGVLAAAEKPALQDEKEKINYSIGFQVGGDFRRTGMEFRPEVLLRGLQDALGEKPPLLSKEEMRTTLVELKKKIVAEDEKQRLARLEKYREEGRQFLAENAKKEGVVTRPSGLQYQIVREGTGKQPTLQDSVTVHYRATRIDGAEFDSSYRDGKPATFLLANVIPGLQEALPMMRVGGKWKLFLPPNLAFGDKGPLEDRTVIYEIELLAVEPHQEKSSQKAEQKKASP